MSKNIKKSVQTLPEFDQIPPPAPAPSGWTIAGWTIAIVLLLILLGISAAVVNKLYYSSIQCTAPSCTTPVPMTETTTGVNPADILTSLAGVSVGNGQGQCNGRHCLQDSLDSINSDVAQVGEILNEWLIYPQSVCHNNQGVFNVSQYFPALLPTFTAIGYFDNIGEPTNYSDPTRTNITYFPGVPVAPPFGSGAGVILPTFPGNKINHTRFGKFQSVPYTIFFFMNLSLSTISPTDNRLTVFLRNLEDRGSNNLEHRRYKAALTKSKVVGRYTNKIDKFMTNIYDSWVINKANLLSTFKSRLIDFFLDFHLGVANHPQFVKDFFSDFLFFISATDSAQVSAIRAMSGHMNTQCVREYFFDRIALIQQTGQTDTITWNWINAGMPVEATVMEAIHNIVAFSQFNHVVQLLVSQAMNPASTPGTGGYTFLKLFSLAGAGVPLSFAPQFAPGYVNTTLYNGTPEQLQINVVREFMRITLPNNLWFSTDRSAVCPTCSVHTQTRHVPQMIQIRAEYEKAGLQFSPSYPWSPIGGPGFTAASQLFAVYDPSRYTAFMAKFSDAVYSGTSTNPPFDASDLPAALTNSINAFHVSPVDNETQIPLGDDSMFPVFTQPIYSAFGLGARRCPGEEFNQFLIFKLFKVMQDLKFYDDCVLNPSRCDPLSPNFIYPTVPLAPFFGLPDSLFVTPVV
jgi:hypothetical protein